jgi:hypothetical protein
MKLVQYAARTVRAGMSEAVLVNIVPGMTRTA